MRPSGIFRINPSKIFRVNSGFAAILIIFLTLSITLLFSIYFLRGKDFVLPSFSQKTKITQTTEEKKPELKPEIIDLRGKIVFLEQDSDKYKVINYDGLLESVYQITHIDIDPFSSYQSPISSGKSFLSNDGKLVIFPSPLFESRVRGGSLVEEVSSSKPFFSPNADKFAVVVRSWRAKDGKPIRIGLKEEDIVRERGLRIYQVDTGEEINRIPEFDSISFWGKENSLISFKNNEILHFDINSKNTENFLLEEKDERIFVAYISREMDKILYTVLPDGEFNMQEQEIWEANLDASGKRKLWKAKDLKTCGYLHDLKPSRDLNYIYTQAGCERPGKNPNGKIDRQNIIINTRNGNDIDINSIRLLAWSPSKNEFIGSDENGIAIYSIEGEKIKDLYQTENWIYRAFWF